MPNLSQLSALLAFLVLLALPFSAAAETVEIPGPDGSKLSLEIHHPPDYQPGKSYSILVSPGDYYWQEGASQPGWVVATGGAFYGPDRLVSARAAIEWLRKTYRPKLGGFHLAGWSANSAGVFEIAMDHPEDFLSVTGIAGMPGRNAESRLKRLAPVRVQFIVGENDTYWRQGSERWHRTMQEMGISSTLEIIPKGEHVMPELIGDPLFERLNRLVEALEKD